MNIMYPREMEWALIGVLASGRTIQDKDALMSISGEDFGDVEAGTVFNAAMGLISKRQVPNVSTLARELTRIYGDKRADEVMEKVVACTTKFGLNTHATRQYVESITEGSMRRALDKLGTELKSAAVDPQSDTEKTSDKARTVLRRTARDADGWMAGGDVSMEAFEASESKTKPVPTGFKELDRVLCGGLVAPELTIVGARPGKGKSAFLLTAAQNAARAGVHTCYISLEMSSVQLGQRMLAAASMVPVSKQRMGSEMLTEHDWQAMTEGLTLIDHEGIGDRLHLYPTYGMTVERLCGVVQDAMDRWKVGLVVIDYMQLLGSVEKTKSDFERLGIVSKRLKEMALMLNIPVLAAAQVRRQDNASGAARAPGLAELRGSGDLEQDADNVILLHCPDSPDDETLKRLPDRHRDIYDRAVTAFALPFSAEVAKQRQGANARTWCLFKPQVMRFFEDDRGTGDTSWVEKAQ